MKKHVDKTASTSKEGAVAAAAASPNSFDDSEDLQSPNTVTKKELAAGKRKYRISRERSINGK